MIETLALLVPVLIAVAYLTYAERKVMAAIQLRKGPNVVGWFGLLQPFADAIKMLTKETIIPSGANRVLFIMAPMHSDSRVRSPLNRAASVQPPNLPTIAAAIRAGSAPVSASAARAASAARSTGERRW